MGDFVMSAIPLHPRLRPLAVLSDVMAVAAETGAKRAQAALRRRRRAGIVRRPGADTPMWNLLVTELRGALAHRGAKMRLARYLGIPKQRVHDFIAAKKRLPDAELALRMLHWLAEERATGHDRTL